MHMWARKKGVGIDRLVVDIEMARRGDYFRIKTLMKGDRRYGSPGIFILFFSRPPGLGGGIFFSRRTLLFPTLM